MTGILIIVSLVIGALATSFAEYKLDYNLVDYVVEFFKSEVHISQ